MKKKKVLCPIAWSILKTEDRVKHLIFQLDRKIIFKIADPKKAKIDKDRKNSGDACPPPACTAEYIIRMVAIKVESNNSAVSVC